MASFSAWPINQPQTDRPNHYLILDIKYMIEIANYKKNHLSGLTIYDMGLWAIVNQNQHA